MSTKRANKFVLDLMSLEILVLEIIPGFFVYVAKISEEAVTHISHSLF